ncbi:hypothetical protein N7478_012766 [Penicillium angulare]|uniref:uncharacterized protein n=1 Tax=Penicillium angulare TaxID=116970 RepID=UPI0025419734|nr:uncharacterized protein N7478_012766 [Penicillium angulare]KAJ5256662.1 hypothetical protein N7478_012766 [Penicillium angulare]
MATKAEAGDTNFTIFIRLPFPRYQFIDPPPVEWNAIKDQALWDILSRPSKGDNIDWKILADNFHVTLPFLLQQAAWLYDRQLSQVRAQMRRFDQTAQSNSPSPSAASGSVTGSMALGGLTSKASNHGRRTSSTSTTTINQFRGSRDPFRAETPTTESNLNEQPRESFSYRPSTNKRDQPPLAPLPHSSPLAEADLSSSSSDSDSERDANSAAQRFRRFEEFSMHQVGLRDDENDEDDLPAFLPITREFENGRTDRAGQELSTTVRLDAERAAMGRRHAAARPSNHPAGSESSASSMSSGAPVVVRNESSRAGHASGTLGSPRVGDMPRIHPAKSNNSGRGTSDGTPSMGSSFSDLDDASVTQSALEEALMSNMQHGGMASRMSTISQALRSRYLQ